MRLWQGAMIGLARSDTITRFMQDYAPTSALSSRFVGGSDVGAFLATARRLHGAKMTTSAFFLGEYVTDPGKVETNVAGILAAIETIDGTEVDLHVSVDPSQIGYAVDDSLGRTNAERIGQALAAASSSGRKILMLDMEDESYVPRTLDLRAHLAGIGLPAAVTIQAYLKRSAADVDALARQGATVRMVKGAFVGASQSSFAGRREIDASYRDLATRMLSPEAREAGARPVFGTHDAKLIAELSALARHNGWKPDEYEFEMLFGVRPALQKQLVDSGESLRLYLPFGRDWWPYAVRRVGENPRNAWLVTKALLSRQ